MPQNQEALKKGWKMTIKRIGLKYIIFPRVSYFLYIGTQNRLFYKEYGISDDKLIFCPYSVDNERFREEKARLEKAIPEMKEKMGIPVTGKIILYSGKYIEKKRPMDLLKAFKMIDDPGCWLVMLGEGELRKEMENYMRDNNMKNVLLTGKM